MRSHRLRLLLSFVFTLGMTYVLASVDWRPKRPPAPPRIERAIQGKGPLTAGAARVDLAPALPATRAGYPPPRPTVERSDAPLYARALVVESGGASVALVDAEVLEIPQEIADAVRERARARGLGEVVVAATHTHSSFGGYDRNPVAQVAGTGAFKTDVATHLTDQLVEAVAQAFKARRPAALSVGRVKLEGVSKNRSTPDGPVDPELTVAVLEAADEPGKRIGELVVFGAHPTLAGRTGDALSGDWPGEAMRRIEEPGGVALFLQGAVGDVSARPPESDEPAVTTMAKRLTEAVHEAEAAATKAQDVQVAAATAEIALPQAEAEHAVPKYLRRPTANGLTTIAPTTAEVTVVTLGPLTLLAIPGEPTVEAAEVLKKVTARPANVVGLAQGYVGYVETRERAKAGEGEARRMYFAPELIERIQSGLEAAAKASPQP